MHAEWVRAEPWGLFGNLFLINPELYRVLESIKNLAGVMTEVVAQILNFGIEDS